MSKQVKKPGAERTQSERRFTTRLIHGAESRLEDEGATLPPIYFSSSYEHESAEKMEALFAGRETGHLYSRLNNPTVERLEQRITDACSARGTLAVASGMAAVTLGLMALLRPGDEIIAGSCMFGGTYTLLEHTLKEKGITTHYVDPSHPGDVAAKINDNTRVVLLEAIANPATVVPDFPAWRTLCDQYDLPLVVDGSLITPYLFDNQKIGADLVFFSATKFIAGPASVIAGLIVDTGRRNWHEGKRINLGGFREKKELALLTKLRREYMASIGPTLSPMNAFLLLLGLETLAIRLERQCENALRIAEFLDAHPKVKKVDYPGLPGHPSHERARSQFGGRFGSVYAFSLEDRQACFAFLNRLKLVKRATNLGDTRTLAIHPASTIYVELWPAERELLGVEEGMIRLSVGLEDWEDLAEDLGQALG